MSAAAARSGGDDRGALLRRAKEKRAVRQEAAHLPVQTALPGLPGVPQTIDPTRYTGTPAERLAALEEALDRATGNVQAAVDMAKSWLDMQRGIVLREIRDSELYKVKADTFEQYVSDRWSMSRPRAYELIKAAPIQLAVSGKTDTAPPSTSHALALAPVYEEAGPEGAAKVHRQVQATAEETGKRPTAQTVRKVARALGYGQPPEVTPADEDQAPDPRRCSLARDGVVVVQTVRAREQRGCDRERAGRGRRGWTMGAVVESLRAGRSRPATASGGTPHRDWSPRDGAVSV